MAVPPEVSTVGLRGRQRAPTSVAPICPGGLLVLPVIVSPCLFTEHDELSRYQCVNDPSRPLSGMSPTDAEATLVSLGRSIDQYFRLMEAALAEPAQTESSRSAATPGCSPRPASSYHGPLVVDRPLNLSFDGAAPGGVPVGWFNSFGHVTGVSTDYGIRVVRRAEDRAAGTCAVLERGSASASEFGSLMQRCPGHSLAGRTLRLEGDLRCENVSGWAGLWLRADADDEPNLFFDNMSRRPITGTTGWTRHFIDAPLPAKTDWLNYGIVLSGAGSLYADEIRLRVWTSEGTWADV